MRLQQILFSQGFGTRRECSALVAAGRVCIGGRVCSDESAEFDTRALQFEVDGQGWPYREHALVLLHKPAGTECSQRPSAWPSVMTLLPPPLRRRGVQSVGRLDQDTTGALLLTDDGALLHRLTSPKWHVPKTYQVRTAEVVTDAQVARLRDGVVLRDDPAPVRAAAARISGPQSLELVLTEGKYHQVKRMLAAVGNPVVALHRSAIGRLPLPAELAPGRWQWVDRDAL